MIESALHTIHAAETLLRGSETRQALNVLGEIDVNSISPNEKAFYFLVWVEAKLSIGEYGVESALSHILEYYGKSDEIEKLARTKFLSGWHYILIGKFFEAKEPLYESLMGFKRVDNWAWQGRVLSRLGFISFQIGEFESAIGFLKRCSEIYGQYNDKKNVLLNNINLAQMNTALGRLSDSLRIYSENEPEIAIVNAKNTSLFFLMHAVSLGLKGNFLTARQTIDKANRSLGELIRERALYFEYLGWIHNLEGDYGKALTALRQGLEISLNIAPESALVSQIKRLMADAHVALGDFEVARKLADEALAVAEKLKERVEIAACHRIYGQLAAFAADTDSAKMWFGKAIKLFAMIGSNYELAVTRYLAAASGAYLNGERHAQLYLAREYFEDEQIEPYIAKINRELTETPLMPSRPAHSNSEVPTIICRDLSMVRMVELAEHIAPSNMSVLLTGPTGSGKDLFARYIHHHSGRSGRFVSVNAAAIPDNMVESELFGYHKGAYTGAAMTTAGWIEEANGGTFYLNEIADSSPELQAKLLDVIENRRICRLGERQEREIDCRIIAATNHDLEQLIAEGRFRLDLYHRLNEIPIHLPGLAGRGGDIEVLLDHFLGKSAVQVKTKADHAAFARLTSIFASRPWPGNIRELEIKVRRLSLLARGDIGRMADMAASELPSKKDETQAALNRTGWNRREVARMLGISESAVRNRIKTYNLAPDSKQN